MQPPQKAYYERLHWDELTQDVSRMGKLALGIGFHRLAEVQAARTDNTLSEERLSIEVDGWTVTGQSDLLEGGAILEGHLLTDYKTTTVAQFQVAPKKDWPKQVNLYAYLWGEHGFPVTEARIVACLKDWHEERADADPDYPQGDMLPISVAVWPKEQQRAYLRQRLDLHRFTWLAVPIINPCTPEDRWQAGWGVFKTGNKRATKRFETRQEAIDWMPRDGKHEIREGEPRRCLRWCQAAPYCPQFAAIKETMDDNGD